MELNVCFSKMATNIDQSQLVIQLRWLKSKNNPAGPTEDIIPQSPVINQCGSEDSELSPKSEKCTH